MTWTPATVNGSDHLGVWLSSRKQRIWGNEIHEGLDVTALQIAENENIKLGHRGSGRGGSCTSYAAGLLEKV